MFVVYGQKCLIIHQPGVVVYEDVKATLFYTQHSSMSKYMMIVGVALMQKYQVQTE